MKIILPRMKKREWFIGLVLLVLLGFSLTSWYCAHKEAAGKAFSR